MIRSAEDLSRRGLLLGALAVALAASGCAALRSVHSEVTSFAQWPSGRAPSSFAFDRLPSQQARADEHVKLEAAAARALAAAGFAPASDATTADVLVQIGARVGRIAQPWEDRFGWPYGPDWPWGYRPHVRGGGWGPGVGIGLRLEPPRFEREVALVIRDRRSGTALYETRASNDGTGSFTPELMAAMFKASLEGFPNPPAGARPVRVEMSAAR
jgi:hypothetical protein